jgi:hypothetical protein
MLSLLHEKQWIIPLVPEDMSTLAPIKLDNKLDSKPEVICLSSDDASKENLKACVQSIALKRALPSHLSIPKDTTNKIKKKRLASKARPLKSGRIEDFFSRK